MDELFPDPKCELNYNKDYELVIAVMLSAQTTDKKVNEVTSVLFSKYPSLEDLSKANREDVIEIIRPLGTHNVKSKNIISIASAILNNGGKVLNDRSFLESLNGVGRKTASVIMLELFNEPYMAVDTHVARVSKRLNLASDKDDVIKIEKKLLKKIPRDKLGRMHHQLVLFGRYYCKSQKPKCDNCKLKNICGYQKKSF